MLKKVTLGFLAATLVLIVACMIVIPLAVNDGVDLYGNLLFRYWQRGTEDCPYPVGEETTLVLEADDVGVMIRPSYDETFWVEYEGFGLGELSLDFAREGNQITATAEWSQEARAQSLEELGIAPGSRQEQRLGMLLDLLGEEGSRYVTFYVPQGVEYQVTGRPRFVSQERMTEAAYESILLPDGTLDEESAQLLLSQGSLCQDIWYQCDICQEAGKCLESCEYCREMGYCGSNAEYCPSCGYGIRPAGIFCENISVISRERLLELAGQLGGQSQAAGENDRVALTLSGAQYTRGSLLAWGDGQVLVTPDLMKLGEHYFNLENADIAWEEQGLSVGDLTILLA